MANLPQPLFTNPGPNQPRSTAETLLLTFASAAPDILFRILQQKQQGQEREAADLASRGAVAALLADPNLGAASEAAVLGAGGAKLNTENPLLGGFDPAQGALPGSEIGPGPQTAFTADPSRLAPGVASVLAESIPRQATASETIGRSRREEARAERSQDLQEKQVESSIDFEGERLSLEQARLRLQEQLQGAQIDSIRADTAQTIASTAFDRRVESTKERLLRAQARAAEAEPGLQSARLSLEEQDLELRKILAAHGMSQEAQDSYGVVVGGINELATFYVTDLAMKDPVSGEPLDFAAAQRLAAQSIVGQPSIPSLDEWVAKARPLMEAALGDTSIDVSEVPTRAVFGAPSEALGTALSAVGLSDPGQIEAVRSRVASAGGDLNAAYKLLLDEASQKDSPLNEETRAALLLGVRKAFSLVPGGDFDAEAAETLGVDPDDKVLTRALLTRLTGPVAPLVEGAETLAGKPLGVNDIVSLLRRFREDEAGAPKEITPDVPKEITLDVSGARDRRLPGDTPLGPGGNLSLPIESLLELVRLIQANMEAGKAPLDLSTPPGRSGG